MGFYGPNKDYDYKNVNLEYSNRRSSEDSCKNDRAYYPMAGDIIKPVNGDSSYKYRDMLNHLKYGDFLAVYWNNYKNGKYGSPWNHAVSFLNWSNKEKNIANVFQGMNKYEIKKIDLSPNAHRVLQVWQPYIKD